MLMSESIKDKVMLGRLKPTNKQGKQGCVERRALNKWEYKKITGYQVCSNSIQTPLHFLNKPIFFHKNRDYNGSVEDNCNCNHA